MNFYINNFALAMPLLFSLLTSYSQAGVVMTGTRVIFPAKQMEKTIQLENKDNFPNLVQVWLDSGDESATAETANAPFMVSPQFFKIEAQQGQMLRLIFSGDQSALPSDRESLFYLNFSEMPAIKSSDIEKNKLLVVFRNRVKVLYRPEALKTSAANISEQLNYTIKKQTDHTISIQLNNHSAYYANLSKLSLQLNGKEIQKEDNITIAPQSVFEWKITPTIKENAELQLQIVLINDYGATIKYQLKHSPS